VGYGDVKPKREGSKLFTIGYIWLGITCVLLLVLVLLVLMCWCAGELLMRLLLQSDQLRHLSHCGVRGG